MSRTEDRETGVYRNYDLRKHVYQGIKDDYRLAAQAAQHVIKKTCDAYQSLKANVRAGRYGKPGSKRRRTVEAHPIVFRWDAAQPYDARMLSWQHDARTPSIWTSAGRLKAVAYTGSPDQLKAVAELPVGECDLVHRGGMWFLYDSDGNRYAGTRLNGYRRRQLRLRKRLQTKDTESARRLPARRRRREARHAANVNHLIAKTIVTEAVRTGRGIAVEDLTGIRERVRLRKPQRVTLSSWSFHQLGAFLAYKARRAGVPPVEVDPRYTSQTCHRCGHRDQRNRPDQETFICRSCGVVAHADHNAGPQHRPMRCRGLGAVNRPHAA